MALVLRPVADVRQLSAWASARQLTGFHHAMWTSDNGIGAIISHPAVLQARVSPRVVRLPVIDRNDIRFKRLSTAQGLSQTKVSQIVQDDQGFMWFGTQYGLNRFDGYNFKVFVNDPKVPNSLSGVFVGALFKDRDGTLWIGCGQFLDRLDIQTETFRRYPVQLVNHISQDSAGMLWLATGKGLHSLDPATGAIRHYSHEPKDPLSLSSNDVKSTGQDKMGHLWVATSEGLDQFDRKTGKVTLHIPLRETAREVSFYEDRFGVFWIIHVTGNGLAVFDRKTNTLTHYSFHDREPPSTALTGVTAVLEDRSGNLWFGTEDEGLLRFDRQQRRFIRYRSHPGDPESIAHDGITSLYEDREGVIWAGVTDSGVTRFETKPPSFQKLPHDLGNPNSNGEPFVSAIYEDRLGTLWIGTRQALSRLNLETGQITSYQPSEPGVAPDVISIVEDRSGRFWVGTFNRGLLLVDRKTGKYKDYRYDSKDPYSLSNDIVTRLLVDRNGTLWAATWDGLNRFDPSTERFTRYKFDPQMKDLLYLELAQDPQGALWLGTHSSGLHRFDPATGRFTVYGHETNRPGSLSDNRVNSVHFDHSGAMWVGTQNGLNRFDPEADRFTVYTTLDGLSGNVVGCILEDSRGTLWMSTNNGISSFNVQSNKFINYSTVDGLPGPDFTGWGACYQNQTGRMFFGGFSGGVAFYPEKVADHLSIPPIVLTDIRLFGKPIGIGVHSPLRRSISYTSALTLSHEQNVFSLEFSALSHRNPESTRYRYKLEGADRQWIEVGSDQRIVTYNGLPSGDYLFRAQASNNYGLWSEPGLQLNIKLLPPWWATPWSRATSLALILLLVWRAHTYRLRQIARQLNVRVEERVGERMRIARELHDTLLQSFISASMLLNVAADQLPSESSAKPAVNRVLQLMRQGIDEGRGAVRDLRGSGNRALDLGQAFSQVAQEFPTQEKLDFRVIVEGHARPLHPLLCDEVYRIGREALVNAYRHSRAKNIEIELEYSPKRFRCLVRDDGCGIDPNMLRSANEGHWGLPGMRERAEQIGGHFSVRSSAAAGTEVELSLPGPVAFQSHPSNGSNGLLGGLARRFGRRTQRKQNPGSEAADERSSAVSAARHLR